jgi:MYXO-CTERM domain-containing protein
MRIVMLGGLAALVLAALAVDASADIGPRHPDRACAGLREGAACTIREKAGTCHGPHPSRLSCVVAKPSSDGSGSAAASADSAAVGSDSAAVGADHATAVGSDSAAAGASNSAAGASNAVAAGSAQTPDPANAEPATTPGHKRGCAVTEPSSAAPVGLVLAALAVRRRRRSRSMS